MPPPNPTQSINPVQEEMSRGYFDDFKQLRDTEGRVISAPDRVIAAQAAPPCPGFQVCLTRSWQDQAECSPRY